MMHHKHLASPLPVLSTVGINSLRLFIHEHKGGRQGVMVRKVRDRQ
jgi:hypothetical protein